MVWSCFYLTVSGQCFPCSLMMCVYCLGKCLFEAPVHLKICGCFCSCCYVVKALCLSLCLSLSHTHTHLNRVVFSYKLHLDHRENNQIQQNKMQQDEPKAFTPRKMDKETQCGKSPKNRQESSSVIIRLLPSPIVVRFLP